METLFFPKFKGGNVFRGAFGDSLRRIACDLDCPGVPSCPKRGQCAYACLFEPRLESGPSGLSDAPRPFVLRPGFPEGRPLPPGTLLTLDVHLFDTRLQLLPPLIASLQRVAEQGLGPGRGRMRLRTIHRLDAQHQMGHMVWSDGRFGTEQLPPLRLSLMPEGAGPDRLRLCFLAPLELKSEGRVAAGVEFPVLLARIRDRVSNLCQLYQQSAPEFDFAGLSTRAGLVRCVHPQLRWAAAERMSSRTGQVHPLAGWLGTVDLEGPLAEFLPLLRAGEWTGAGRQTVWGKGSYRMMANADTRPAEQLDMPAA